MGLPSTPPGSSGGGMSGSDISNLVQLFTNKNSSGTSSGTQSTQNTGAVTNTGTTTTGTTMSSDAMAAMLKSILEGTQGLASTAMGEHSAGLYNSSTNTLLQNDLMTRAAAQVAQNTKTQTVTQNTAQTDTRGSTTSNVGATTSKTAAPVAPGTAAKAAAALSGVNAISKFLPDGMGKDIVSKIKSAVGLGGANTAQIPGAGFGAVSSNGDAAGYDPAFGSTPSSSGSNVAISDAGADTPVDVSGGSSDVANGAADAINSIGSVDVSSAGGDYGSVDSSGAGYDPGAFDAASTGAENIADGFTDAGSAAADTVGGFDWGDIFAADGGMITDPNRPDGPAVSSNLSFAQQNPVAMQMASAIRARSSAAGYADGGAVSDAPVKSESIFARRAAAIDAAESGTVQGSDTNAAYQDRMNQQSKPAPADSSKSSGSSGFIPSIRKVLHLANGGAVGFFDDGGHVDLTNLGLRVQSADTKTGSGLTALNAPDSSSSTSDTSGSAVTGPMDQGTGFANTSNQALTTAVTGTPSKKSTSPANGNTAQVPAGESNSAAPGTAQGGIDGNPGAVSSAAGTIGLAGLALAVPALAPLAPLLNLALTALNAPSANSGTGGGATSSAAAAASAAGVSDAVGSVSVGTMSGDASTDSGVDGTGPGTSGIGMSAGDAASAANGSDGPGVGATGASDGSDSASNGDAGTSGASGGGTSGDSGTGGDSASAGDGGGNSLAVGGNVTGPGTDDSDSIPAKLSNGEFVVNAAAAAHFRPILEMMNNAVRAK